MSQGNGCDSAVVEPAIECGLLCGRIARTHSWPVDVFEIWLTGTLDLWRDAGCDDAEIELVVEAARTAYWGAIN